MSGGHDRSFESAVDLARAFDAAFALAPQTDRGSYEDLLGLRVADDAYAVQVSQVAGLLKDRRVTPLPGSLPELRGVAGVRGSIVPVYDLRTLLGYSSGAGSTWLVLASTPEAVGFAFDVFEGQFRVPRGDIASQKTEPLRRHVGRAVRIGETVRQIVDLASLVEVVRERLVALRARGST